MPKPVSITRIRVGLIIWICSFLPFPSITLHILHDQGKLQDPQQSSLFLAICYTIQFIIGFIGLIIAGTAAAGVIKHTKLSRKPAALWGIVIHGRLPDSAVADAQSK